MAECRCNESRLASLFSGPLMMIGAGVFTLLFTLPAAALDLAIETTPDEPEPGQWVQTRVIVTNPGAAPSQNLRVELIYPDGFLSLPNNTISDGGNCAATGFSTDCRAGEPMVWNLAPLQPGKSRVLHFTARLATNAVAGQVIPFNGDVIESGQVAAAASHTVEVSVAPILALSVDADLDPVAPGQALTWVLNYAHRGPSATTNTELRFPIPAGTSFLGSDGNGTVIGNEVVWNLGILNPGEASRRSVRLQLGPGVDAGDLVVVDQASIQGQFEFEGVEAGASAVTRVEDEPALGLAIAAGGDAGRPGEVAWVQLTVTNRSDAPIQDLALDFLFPDGFNTLNNDMILDGGNCSTTGFSTDCRAGEPVRWVLDALGPRQGRTVALAPVIADAAPAGRALSFQARARAAGHGDQWDRQTLRVGPDLALTLSIAARNDPVKSGEPLVIDLAYGNAGGIAAAGTTLRLPVPAGLDPVAISDGGSFVDGAVVWSLGLLNSGEIGRRHVRFEVQPALQAGEVVKFDSARIAGELASFLREAWGRTAVRFEDSPALNVSLAARPAPAATDDQVPAEIVVTNTTDSLLTGVRVELLMPDGMSTMPNNTVSDGGNCSGSGFSTDCRRGEPVIWDLGNLPPGQGRTVRFQPIVASNTAVATARRFEARAFADVGADRWSRQHVLVHPARPLMLNVDASHDPVQAGALVDYTLTFGNSGNTAVTDAVLEFPLPAGVELVEAEGATLTGGTLRWNIPLLDIGESSRRQVRVLVDADARNADLVEVADARLAGTFAFAEAAAWARTFLRVEQPGALGLEIDLAPDPAMPAERLVPRLTVSNRSSAVLTAVRVDMPYPDLATTLANNLIQSGGSCSGSGFSTDCRRGEPVIWNLGNLPPDSGRTFWLPPQAASTAPSGRIIPLRPRVFADGQRPVSLGETVPILAGRHLNLTMDTGPAPLAPGATTSLRLHFGNQSDQGVQEAVLRLPIPDGVDVLAADGNGIIGDQEVFWDIGTIPAGRVGHRNVSLAVSPDAGAGEIARTLRAGLTGLVGTVVAEAWADGSLRLAGDAPLDLDISFTPSIAAPGTALSGVLTVTNRRPTIMPDVSLRLFFPNSLQTLANSAIPDGGNCSGSGFSTDCRYGETVLWELGNLGPSEMRSRLISPVVATGSSAPPDGTLIQFFAAVDNTTGGQAVDFATVKVGEFLPPPPPPVPQISLTGNGNPIQNGSQTIATSNNTDFGEADFDGGSVLRSFVISNPGTGPLNLTGNPRVAISGQHQNLFTVTQQPPSVVAAGGQTSFTIRFQPDNVGVRTATVTIPNDTTSANPFTFAIGGTGVDPSGELIFKDGFEN